MGCCGKGASIKGNKNQAFANGALKEDVNMDDMSQVEYVGRKSTGSTFNVYGFATSTQYRVRVGTPFYVSNKDLISSVKGQGILQKYEGTEFAYVQVKADEPEPVIEDVAVVEKADVQVVQEYDYTTLEELVQTEFKENEPEELDWSFLDGNLTAVKVELRDGNYSQQHLSLLLAYELSNKNRQGAVSLIEELTDSE